MLIKNYEEAREHPGEICRVGSDYCYTGPNTALQFCKIFLFMTIWCGIIGVILGIAVLAEWHKLKGGCGRYVLLLGASFFEFLCIYHLRQMHHYSHVVFVHVQKGFPTPTDDSWRARSLQFTVTVDGRTEEVRTAQIFQYTLINISKLNGYKYENQPHYAGYDESKKRWVILMVPSPEWMDESQ